MGTNNDNVVIQYHQGAVAAAIKNKSRSNPRKHHSSKAKISKVMAENPHLSEVEEEKSESSVDGSIICGSLDKPKELDSNYEESKQRPPLDSSLEESKQPMELAIIPRLSAGPGNLSKRFSFL